MGQHHWTAKDIPSQSGKTIIITGANSGLGLEAARVLSGKGAEIILAVRNIAKGNEAAASIRAQNPKAELQVLPLDLGDLESIPQFVDQFRAKHTQLHALLNNAGVMFPPKRDVTRQGFELHWGTNHLAHYALTVQLFDILKKTPGARIVTQSSVYHKIKADIHFDDLNWEKTYDKEPAYAQSKLANILFAYELDRQLKAHKIDAISLAAHPGYTSTGLQRHLGFMGMIMNALVAQRVEMGTLPLLRAATEPNLLGGEYIGPTKMRELRGYPEKVKSSDPTYDLALAKRLWEVTEKATGLKFTF